MAIIHTANGQRSLIPDYAAQRHRGTFWIVALLLIVVAAGVYLSAGPSTSSDTNAAFDTADRAGHHASKLATVANCAFCSLAYPLS